MEEGTFELRCGVTLHLRQVNRQALRPIMLKLGGGRTLQDPERLRKLTGKAMERATQGIEQLFNYCAGWGVIDEAPEEAVAELGEMGFRVDTVRLARINWIRYLLVEDETEGGELVGAVLTYSSKDWLAQDEEIEEQEQEEAKAE
jgi:hypothetical protein